MLDLSAYVSVPQAARELAVHPETVRRLLRQGLLPGSKAGTLWFIAKKDLRCFKATYDPRTGPKKRARENGDKA
jgi:excisionase family DNA binding protein